MALKIISGLLAPLAGERSHGSATIRLADAKVAPGGGAKFTEVNVIGAGDFVGRPCKHLALRHFVHEPKSGARFNLNDDFIVENGVVTAVKISWVAETTPEREQKLTEIHEISVLIIGETA